MSLTFSLLFMAFVVVVSVKLWCALDKVEKHLDKLDGSLEQRGYAAPESHPTFQKRFAHRAGL